MGNSSTKITDTQPVHVNAGDVLKELRLLGVTFSTIDESTKSSHGQIFFKNCPEEKFESLLKLTVASNLQDPESIAHQSWIHHYACDLARDAHWGKLTILLVFLQNTLSATDFKERIAMISNDAPPNSARLSISTQLQHGSKYEGNKDAVKTIQALIAEMVGNSGQDDDDVDRSGDDIGQDDTTPRNVEID